MSQEVFRILDANANRAAEGLRVVEEYARFVLHDRHLTECLKTVRHDLATTLSTLPAASLIALRDTLGDVGVEITTAKEYERLDLPSVWMANQKRVEQSLRCLEEYVKTISAEAATAFEQLRYRTYTLAKAIDTTARSRTRLSDARLYVLVDGRSDEQQFDALIQQLLDSNVGVIQLREKQLPDRALLQRARLLRELTRGSNTLFVMNDRPDLAVLADADGVHVGQDELDVADVRRIVGAERIIGVSTHDIDQARRAVLEGANYIGCGPTFPSTTKHFPNFPGLEFLEEVVREIGMPAFAIGGITLENVAQVLATGFMRVAVSGAVTRAPSPQAASQQFIEVLTS